MCLVAACVGLVAACGGGGGSPPPPPHLPQPPPQIKRNFHPPPDIVPAGIHKVRHVVIIMQENRSFDTYFGTYPGADGIPGLAGHPGAVPCVPDPATGECVRPFHDTADR